MKKILSVLLVAVMLLAMIPSTAFAAPIPEINIPAPAITATADRTSVEVGDIITVTVEVPDNSNLVDFTYVLRYDTAYFAVQLSGLFQGAQKRSGSARQKKHPSIKRKTSNFSFCWFCIICLKFTKILYHKKNNIS